MTTMTSLTVSPIAADVLDGFRHDVDGLGNPMAPFAATGGEPLRCCLRRAAVDDTIALVSYSPTPVRGPWQEFGPVFVHAQLCEGFRDTAVLPDELREGPCVLRAYRADGSMAYDANRVVDEGDDIEPALVEILAREDVCEVHVRTLVPQCFLFTVR